jgi:phospholipase/lecithinase/hemolysin
VFTQNASSGFLVSSGFLFLLKNFKSQKKMGIWVLKSFSPHHLCLLTMKRSPKNSHIQKLGMNNHHKGGSSSSSSSMSMRKKQNAEVKTKAQKKKRQDSSFTTSQTEQPPKEEEEENTEQQKK